MLETLSQKEIIKELDEMNKETFRYFGVWHIRSGWRFDVENHAKFIKKLEADPVREIVIRETTNPALERILKHAIVCHFDTYVNIYDINNVKMKPNGLSKDKCILKLEESE